MIKLKLFIQWKNGTFFKRKKKRKNLHPNKSQMTSFFFKKKKHSYQTRPDKLTQDLQSYPSLNLAKPRPAIGLDKTV